MSLLPSFPTSALTVTTLGQSTDAEGLPAPVRTVVFVLDGVLAELSTRAVDAAAQAGTVAGWVLNTPDGQARLVNTGMTAEADGRVFTVAGVRRAGLGPNVRWRVLLAERRP